MLLELEVAVVVVFVSPLPTIGLSPAWTRPSPLASGCSGLSPLPRLLRRALACSVPLLLAMLTRLVAMPDAGGVDWLLPLPVLAPDVDGCTDSLLPSEGTRPTDKALPLLWNSLLLLSLLLLVASSPLPEECNLVWGKLLPPLPPLPPLPLKLLRLRLPDHTSPDSANKNTSKQSSQG
jgi:hypothetical protein